MELSQEEKELIIVALGNSLADPEQEDIHEFIPELYDRLQNEWGTTYHSSQEIIAIRKQEKGR